MTGLAVDDSGPGSAAETADPPEVAVVILNWNSWSDLLECLESVLRLHYPALKVIVCDNASTDGSVERILQWAGGDLCAFAERREMAGFSVPPASKPLRFQTLDSTDADWPVGDQAADVTLIRNPENAGFAAGNNVGLRYALHRNFPYVWLLNADTVVDPKALDHLVARMRETPTAGLCGSLLCYYDDPDVLQEAGGCAYYPMLGIARRLAPDQRCDKGHDWRRLETRMGYVSGASCLVTRDFLLDVGLMAEDYFLYCEEIDWATRARGEYALALAEQSVVYHKKGAATGSKTLGKVRNPASEYYLWRARARFTRRYHPFGMIGLGVFGALSWLGYFLRGRRGAAKALASGFFDRQMPRSK